MAKPASFQVYISLPPWVCWIKFGKIVAPPTDPERKFQATIGHRAEGCREGVVGGIAGVEEHLVTDPFFGNFCWRLFGQGKIYIS